MTFSTDSQRPFNLAWHVSLPAGLADRLCRGAGHQSAHGTGRSSGRFDEWHMPDCVGGGVAVCESLPTWIGKKIQTVKLAASNLMLGKSTRGISQGKNG